MTRLQALLVIKAQYERVIIDGGCPYMGSILIVRNGWRDLVRDEQVEPAIDVLLQENGFGPD